ncbi:unnamed protein product [Kuraishia capsulata CBS 1993]|uniref:CREG-like beta-barrel domain-containing protein n=1 Tax=Kuraishia capsulata CBS 1993 TaxID=1382522 RepID=W6MLG7_9ASCO|nr:uncharacterized protein KUCA_T00003304001 [Kuraishia capsulata CBS 1993]CDK27326.1 unnamed protein product [Kuraishia capsulata CBS 1993]
MVFMKILPLIFALLALPSSIATDKYHDSKTAASVSRTLIQRESLAMVNTVYEDELRKGYPVSFAEYYVDCDHTGEPILLMVEMSTSMVNIRKNSSVSLSIKVGDHDPHDKVDDKYPGRVAGSIAGSPRVSLRGHLEPYHPDPICPLRFARKHPDSTVWFPGNAIHSTNWYRFVVEGVYFIGGFGDRAYIGEIPVEEYLDAEPLESGILLQ